MCGLSSGGRLWTGPAYSATAAAITARFSHHTGWGLRNLRSACPRPGSGVSVSLIVSVVIAMRPALDARAFRCKNRQLPVKVKRLGRISALVCVSPEKRPDEEGDGCYSRSFGSESPANTALIARAGSATGCITRQPIVRPEACRVKPPNTVLNSTRFARFVAVVVLCTPSEPRPDQPPSQATRAPLHPLSLIGPLTFVSRSAQAGFLQRPDHPSGRPPR